MSLYKLASNPAALTPRFDGVDAQTVQANSTTEAKALAKARIDGDVDSVWDNTTPVDLLTIPVLTGWSFNVHVNTATATDVTVVGDADDLLDDIGTKLAAALVAAGHGTAHAAYNTGTNLLTVASIADNIGDKTVTVTVTPPVGLFPTGYAWAQADVVGAIVNGGIAGAVLTVQLSTTWVIPARISAFKQ